MRQMRVWERQARRTNAMLGRTPVDTKSNGLQLPVVVRDKLESRDGA